MKKIFIGLLIFVVILSLQSIVLAENLKIKDYQINFNIEPKEINDNTYIPAEQLKNIDDFILQNINEIKYFIVYNNNFYMIEENSEKVKASTGDFTIKNYPIRINNNLLLSFELIKEIFGKDIISSNNVASQLNLNIEKTIGQQNEKMHVDIEVINNSNQDLTLEFSSSQKYNILIKTKDNEVIYDWAQGKMFAQVFIEETIKAKGSINFKEEIDLSNLDNGIYYLEVFITAVDKDIKSNNIMFIIEN